MIASVEIIFTFQAVKRANDFHFIPMQEVEGNISMTPTPVMILIVALYLMWALDTRQTLKVGKHNVCSCQI